jgi:hypothetical protein
MQSVVIVMKEGSGTMQVGGWVEGSSFRLVCGVAHVIRRVTDERLSRGWKSPIFPIPAWRAGQASSEIWGSTLVTFTKEISISDYSH